jgi:hypothetical protein
MEPTTVSVDNFVENHLQKGFQTASNQVCHVLILFWAAKKSMKSISYHEKTRNDAIFFGVISFPENCGLVSAPTRLRGPFKAVLRA